jgi:hypothetical protein
MSPTVTNGSSSAPPGVPGLHIFEFFQSGWPCCCDSSFIIHHSQHLIKQPIGHQQLIDRSVLLYSIRRLPPIASPFFYPNQEDFVFATGQPQGENVTAQHDEPHFPPTSNNNDDDDLHNH